MQKLLSEVLSFTLLPDQIKDLRKEFEIMDTDGSGEISLEALKKVLVSNAGAGSLGALTEEEVEDIFDAMRVNKKDTRIHWHEFIAAGLSQCQVDDRNLRLAFDRLDGDHKGYITLDDIFKLVGNDELQNEDQMRLMWTESMRNLNCTQRHITYDNFLLLMKGQTSEPEGLERKKSTHLPSQLHSLPENAEVDGGRIISFENGGEEAVSTDDEACQVPVVEGSDLDPDHFIPRPSLDESSFTSLPNMDANPMFESSGSISPSPSGKKSVSGFEFEVSSMVPNLGAISKPSIVTRKRSKSLESETLEAAETSAELTTGKIRTGDRRLALALPEHCLKNKIKDDLANKSALAVNRHLYRGHRQMRLSFLDACKRFEEQQASRARDTLMKEQVKEAMGAGLVMRHGTKFQVTSEAIRKYLDEAQAEQQVLLDKANRRGGRGRSARKKTISDMSAMMNPSMGQEELGAIATRAAAKTPEANREIMNSSFSSVHDMPDLSISGMGDGKAKLAFKPTSMAGGGSEHKMKPEDVLPPNLPEVDHVSVRKATVPGKFHKTTDPFSLQGMYGGARLQNEAVSQIQSPSHPISSRHHTTNPT
jgi:Ca2+-binding EF-hand superfamily protein